MKGYDEPEILRSQLSLFGPISADAGQNDLPDYRKIGATLIIEDSKLYEVCHTVPLFQSIAELERLLTSDDSLTYAYPPGIAKILRDGMDIQFDIRAIVSKNQLEAPINAVKNIVLDWAVDLEKAGITGEGLGFSADDKKEAQTVTQNIYAQNIGNLGDVSDKSSVNDNLSNNTFTVGNIEKHIQQIQECLPALPPNAKEPISAQLKKIEASKAVGDTNAIRTAFLAIKSVCEKTASNIAAQGIVSLIKNMFG